MKRQRLAVLLMLIAASTWSRADSVAVEYHHSGFDHYFLTPVPEEIAILDAAAPPFESWSRTGVTFRVFDNVGAPAGSVAICRFFNDSFAPKSSHFYAPRGSVCEDVIAKFPDWQLENDHLFNAMMPADDGTCPVGTVPLYRLYNNGMGGAPNHRFVPSLVDRQAMLDKGFVAEGAGIGVGMCIPPGDGAASGAEGVWRGTTADNRSFRMTVLDDGTYYIAYSPSGSTGDEGVVQGTSTGASGVFTSSDYFDFQEIHVPTEGFGITSAKLMGQFVPHTSLQLQIGQTTVSTTYDSSYDHPASLADLAGNYTGKAGHREDAYAATASIDADGNAIIQAACHFSGKAVPRGSVNVFDFTIQPLDGVCLGGPGHHFSGILYLDSAARQIHIFVGFVAEGQDIFFMTPPK